MAKSELHKMIREKTGKGNPLNELLRRYLFYIAQKYKKNKCSLCEQKIKRYEDISVHHIKPWRKTKTREFNKKNFYDIDNLSVCHRFCNTPDDKNNKKSNSKYIGIVNIKYTWGERWEARLNMGIKTYYVGSFEYAIDAAIARDIAVIKARNGAGVLNFPEKRKEYIRDVIIQRKS